MTGSKENSEFYFPETLNISWGKAKGNIEGRGKQNSLFPEGPVIGCFGITPSKIENTAEKNYLPDTLVYFTMAVLKKTVAVKTGLSYQNITIVFFFAANKK